MSSTNLRLQDYKSALSPYVRKLVLENTISDGEDTKVLNKHGIIDFSYICSKLEGMLNFVLRAKNVCVCVNAWDK